MTSRKGAVTYGQRPARVRVEARALMLGRVIRWRVITDTGAVLAFPGWSLTRWGAANGIGASLSACGFRLPIRSVRELLRLALQHTHLEVVISSAGS